MRYLGLSGALWGAPGLISHDRQRMRPHLSVSLIHFFDVLRYLIRLKIRLYRLAPDFAPFLTHPERPRWHDQVAECAAECAVLRAEVVQAGIRLSMHLPLSISFTSPDAAVRRRTLHTVEAQARLLLALGGPDSIMVAHLGARYASAEQSLQRVAALLDELPYALRQLLAFEHDEQHWRLPELLALSAHIGVPVVFDWQHYLTTTAPPWDLAAALNAALATWPAGRVPKIHLSSPRTEARIAAGRRIALPRWSEHSDLVHPFELVRLAGLQAHRPFDVMLEAKAGDLALRRARDDLRRWLGFEEAP